MASQTNLKNKIRLSGLYASSGGSSVENSPKLKKLATALEKTYLPGQGIKHVGRGPNVLNKGPRGGVASERLKPSQRLIKPIDLFKLAEGLGRQRGIKYTTFGELYRQLGYDYNSALQAETGRLFEHFQRTRPGRIMNKDAIVAEARTNLSRWGFGSTKKPGKY